MIDLDAYQDELVSINAAWLDAVDDTGPEGYSIEEASDALNTLYPLLTRLRVLKRQLNQLGEGLRDHHIGGGRLTRQSLKAFQRDQARCVAVLSDINTLYYATMEAVVLLEKTVGKATYLYTLTDPRTGIVRYVGKTDHPRQRLYQHLQHPTNDDMAAWIADLAGDALTPVMDVIEVVMDADWAQREARHIWRFRDMGYDLLNRDGP